MKRVVKLKLTPEDMSRAIREIEDFKRDIIEKSKELLQEMARIGCEATSFRFAWAAYDGTNDVSCRIENRGETAVAVVATGNATLFIEFGTGILYADNHPESAQNGMIRGGYGRHQGLNPDGWRYKGDPGTNGVPDAKHPEKVHTYGNPANMSMYQSIRDLERDFEIIARRVFA